jgi:hypothetical protein
MIKVTLKELLQASDTNIVDNKGALARFYSSNKSSSPSERWEARKAPSICDETIKEFKVHEKEIYVKHGKNIVDASGNPIVVVPPENIEAFRKEYEELLSQTIELPGNKVKVSNLLTTSLSEIDMSVLEPWLTE